MPAGGGRLRKAGEAVVGFLNPGPAGSLFILFFIALLAVMTPIAFRVGKLLVKPIRRCWTLHNHGE